MSLQSQTRSTSTRKTGSTERAQLMLRQLLGDEDTFMTTLLVIFIDEYGTEALMWHPETIRLELQDDFNVTLPKENFDKLMTGIMVLTTDYFYKEVSRFIRMCNIISGDDFDPEVFDPADSLEMAWAITEVLMIDPPEESEPFDDEIRAYVGEVLKEEGYVTPPDVLRIALDADLSAQVSNDFADDPEMFQAIHQSQTAKADEVNGIIQANLQSLWTQLTALPLQNGTTKNLIERMRN